MSNYQYPNDQGQAAGAIPVYMASLVAGTVTNLAIGATAISMSTKAATTKLRVVAGAACWISFGSLVPTVGGAGCIYLPANIPMEFALQGMYNKIWCIQDATATGKYMTVIEF